MKLIMENWRKFTTEVLGQETMATTMDDLGRSDETAANNWITQNSNLPEKGSLDEWLDEAWAALTTLAGELAKANLGPEAIKLPGGAMAAPGGFDPVATIAHAILNHPSMPESGGVGAAIAAAELAYSQASDPLEHEEED